MTSAVLLTTLLLIAQPPAVKRAPAPPAVAVQRSRDLISELFADDLKSATTADAHRKLSSNFADQAGENVEEPANRYALLEAAQKHAALGNDLPRAMALVDEMLSSFDADPLAIKTQVISTASNAATAETARDILDAATPLLREAIDADRFVQARELARVSKSLAATHLMGDLIASTDRQMSRVLAIEAAHRTVRAAVEKLKYDPDDAEANLELGRYHGFLKGRWDRGLPLLAAGKDDAIKSLAKRDFSNPGAATDQLALADAWWDLSLREPEPARSIVQERAALWYRRALPNLTGLSRAKASKRSAGLVAEK